MDTNIFWFYRKGGEMKGFYWLFTKTLGTVLTLGIMFVPTLVFFLAKNAMNPVGFWQVFAVYGGGIFLFGGLQVGFIIFGIWFIREMWRSARLW